MFLELQIQNFGVLSMKVFREVQDIMLNKCSFGDCRLQSSHSHSCQNFEYSGVTGMMMEPNTGYTMHSNDMQERSDA